MSRIYGASAMHWPEAVFEVLLALMIRTIATVSTLLRRLRMKKSTKKPTGGRLGIRDGQRHRCAPEKHGAAMPREIHQTDA